MSTYLTIDLDFETSSQFTISEIAKTCVDMSFFGKNFYLQNKNKETQKKF